MDTNLEGYINKYDKWLEQDLISYSSKVIPIKESMDNVKHIIPSQQAMQILKKARLITIAKCICRQRYKNCDKPLEVCFILTKSNYIAEDDPDKCIQCGQCADRCEFNARKYGIDI